QGAARPLREAAEQRGEPLRVCEMREVMADGPFDDLGVREQAPQQPALVRLDAPRMERDVRRGLLAQDRKPVVPPANGVLERPLQEVGLVREEELPRRAGTGVEQVAVRGRHEVESPASPHGRPKLVEARSLQLRAYRSQPPGERLEANRRVDADD